MFAYIKWILSAVLLSAAGIKLISIDDLLRSDGILSSPTMLALAIGFEVAGAIAIDFLPRLHAMFTALFVCSMLGMTAAWTWVSNQDCDCFGLNTPSGLPLLVDVVCISAVVVCLARGEHRWPQDERTLDIMSGRSVAIIASLVGLTAGAYAWMSAEQRRQHSNMPLLVGVELIGDEFFLLFDNRVSQVMSKSEEWLVYFLRSDCSHCRELVRSTRQLDSREPRVMTVSVSDSVWTVIPDSLTVEPSGGTGEIEITWESSEPPFVAAPTVVAIRSSTIVRVWSGDDVDELIENTYEKFYRQVAGRRSESERLE